MLIVLGKHGQVARELQRQAVFQQRPHICYGSDEADFNTPERVIQLLKKAPAGSIVINAAAYTQVDLAESEAELAHQLNTIAPTLIARTCRQSQLRMVHLSTDYVFSGEQRGPYAVDAVTAPSGVYGQTKLAGEQGVLAELPQAIILRTSWVFSAHGKNFVKTMLRLGSQHDEISVVNDQTGGPTSAKSIAMACLNLADRIATLSDDSSLFGIYHFSGAPVTTWAGFATEIFRQAQRPVTVLPISTSQYPTPAQRPANSALDCSKLQNRFNISQPDWRIDLAEVLQELQSPG